MAMAFFQQGNRPATPQKCLGKVSGMWQKVGDLALNFPRWQSYRASLGCTGKASLIHEGYSSQLTGFRGSAYKGANFHGHQLVGWGSSSDFPARRRWSRNKTHRVHLECWTDAVFTLKEAFILGRFPAYNTSSICVSVFMRGLSLSYSAL